MKKKKKGKGNKETILTLFENHMNMYMQKTKGI